MYKIALILSVLILFSCKKEVTQTMEVIPSDVEMKHLEQEMVILKDGALLIPDWVELANFQEELKSVGSQKIKSTKALEQLINLLMKLKGTTPEKFKQEAIKARIKVLETEMLMYNQFVSEQDFKNAATRKIEMQKAYNLTINQIEALLIKERDYEKYK